MDEDFVYFVHGAYFGLASFKKINVSNQDERGVRMKSVAILTTSQHTIHKHHNFLSEQVSIYINNDSQSGYESLEQYYDEYKGTVLRSLVSQALGFGPDPSAITHPSGCFDGLINKFGSRLFGLWKLALLHRRILFFSPPPVGPLCHHVHSTLMLSLNDKNVTDNRAFKPWFYVNVADIDCLTNELAYVACTTERVFEEKGELWDVFVSGSELRTENNALQDIVKTTCTDKARFKQLQQMRQNATETYTDEEIISKYFRELNNLVFDTLVQCTEEEDRLLTLAALEHMHLDSSGDRAFVIELLETYGIDLTLEDTKCCNI